MRASSRGPVIPRSSRPARNPQPCPASRRRQNGRPRRGGGGLVGEEDPRPVVLAIREALHEPRLDEGLDLAPARLPHERHVLAGSPVEERRQLGAQPVERHLLVAQDAPLAHLEAQGRDVHRRPVPLDGRHHHEHVPALEAEAPLLVEVQEVRVGHGRPGLDHHVGQRERSPQDGLAVAALEALLLPQLGELQARRAGDLGRVGAEGRGHGAGPEGRRHLAQVPQRLAAALDHLGGHAARRSDDVERPAGQDGDDRHRGGGQGPGRVRRPARLVHRPSRQHDPADTLPPSTAPRSES